MKNLLNSSRFSFFVLLTFILSAWMTGIQANTQSTSPTLHPQQPFPPAMQQFIAHMVSEYHFDQKQLNDIMSQAEIIPPVIHSIEKPLETTVTWDNYRKFFLTSQRIKGGLAYWQQHQETLAEAQQKYGVDPSVIVAIIGVETLYGTVKERYQVLGALTTLAFYHQQRSAFFEHELEQFLLLTRQFKLSPLNLRGSYAGAMGIPQFMPSSYLRFAVSYTHNPQIDLFNNDDDAIMSIANYLHCNGWQFAQPVAVPAQIAQASPPAWLISKTAAPQYRIETLAKFGVLSPTSLSASQKTALIAMQNTHRSEYWLVFPNFHAIMSYNPRTSYALAVYQLSQTIDNQYAEHIETSRTTIAAR